MCPDGTTADDRGIADEMIERRKEKTTIDALHDLVAYLRGVREERKAVLAITDGWRLFQPHEQLARKVTCDIPLPQVGVDPRTGKLTGRTPTNGFNGPKPDSCEPDRMTLAYMDDDSSFRLLIDEANAANTSFYPIDPRGLVVFDESIGKPVTGVPPAGSTTITPPSVDMARLRARIDSLRTLGEATDGLAITGSNDLARGLKRVVDDLSSYYLIGYYSNGKLDGKFHSISVKVKRPGVRVRARRGYQAATPASAATMARGAGGRSAPALESPETLAAHAVEAAIAPLSGYARDVPLRLQLAAGWKPNDSASAAMWVVGELGGVATMGDTWAEGFDATVTLTTAADATVGTARISVPRGGRTFRVAVTAVTAARGGRVRAAGRRAGRRRLDPVTRNGAADDPGGARGDWRPVRAPRRIDRQQGGADRRSAVPPQRAGPGGDPDAVERSGDGAPARSHRQTAGGPGDGRGARRFGWIAVGNGTARARAARAWRLRGRDCARRQADDLRLSESFHEGLRAFRGLRPES